MMANETKTGNGKAKSALAISAKSFFQAGGIILALMIVSGILTKVVPAGKYDRIIAEGRELVVDDSYRQVPRPDYPVWRWFTSPAEVLLSPDAIIVIVLIIFMLFVGAAFHVLEEGGILTSMLSLIVARYRSKRYLLMGVIMLFFMVASSILGIYEELVPAVVFIVPLALVLGWDSLTGLGMSLLALAFGFAASVTNPFTVGVAQSIAGLPLFSGASFRLVFFLTVFAISYLFVYLHARKVEKNPESSPTYLEDTALRAELALHAPLPGDSRMKNGIAWMTAWFGIAIVFIFTVTRFESLSQYAFPVVALIFLVAGTGAGILAGMGKIKVAKSAVSGSLSMVPAIILILMAMSVKVIIKSGGILDTVLFYAASLIQGTHPVVAAFLMYAVTLGLEFFIASASAKAFLVMPILVPLADLSGVTRQSAVFAFDLGDGFSNMIYPTNALLLIALGLTAVSYPKWIKWTLPVQGVIFLVSMVFLAVAVLFKFGPF